MSASSVRRIALLSFVLGVPGMIISSIQSATGAAITFGLLAAGAAVVLIAVTAVTTGRIPPEVGAPGPAPAVLQREADAEALEQRIRALVTEGANEAAVRDLVRAAVRLSRPARDERQSVG